MQTDKPTSYRARWVLPGDRPPISNGVVTIGDEKILAVESGDAFDVDLGDVVLTPGFVNVHCHLDLSDSSPLTSPPTYFAAWLKRVVDERRTKPPLRMDAIAKTCAGMKRQGTSLLGDVAHQNVTAKAASAAALAGVTFGEVLGLRAERYQPLLDEIDASLGTTVARRGIGLSPHAPYSTAAAVYQAATRRPKCTHWLESPDEIEFLKTGGGPLRVFLEDIGAWPYSAPRGSWYADPWAELLGDPSEWLLVHANFTSQADLDHALKLSNGRPLQIAYCPRTHAAFGFNEYPLQTFLDAGCLVGLGTDSLASNPDLDVFNEARFIAERFPKFADERLLRMLTLDGARLLGCDANFGSLTTGKAAAILMLQSPRQPGGKFDWIPFFGRETSVLGWLTENSGPAAAAATF